MLRMYLLRLWNWLLGFIEISASDGFRSIFIESLKEMKVDMWHISLKGDEMFLRVSCSKMKEIYKAAKKSGMKIKVTKKCGLPFLVYKNRSRVGIPIGIMLFTVIMFALSGYVWNISFELGDSTVSEEVLSETLSELGLKVGSKISDIDFYMLQNDCLLRLDTINWIGISREGTKVTVRVKDKTEKPELYTDETPCSVRATRDGQILTVLPYEGRSLVKAGATVKKGDVIVSGIDITNYGEIRMTHAKADVAARTYYTEEFFVPFKIEKKVRNGENESVKSLFFFGKTIKFPINSRNYGEEYDIIYSTDYIEILGVTLPIGIITQTYEKCKIITVERNEEELKKTAEEEIRKKEEEIFANKVIDERKVSGKRTENGYEITVKYKCIEDIGFEEVILDEEYEKTVAELRKKLPTS